MPRAVDPHTLPDTASLHKTLLVPLPMYAFPTSFGFLVMTFLHTHVVLFFFPFSPTCSSGSRKQFSKIAHFLRFQFLHLCTTPTFKVLARRNESALSFFPSFCQVTSILFFESHPCAFPPPEATTSELLDSCPLMEFDVIDENLQFQRWIHVWHFTQRVLTPNTTQQTTPLRTWEHRRGGLQRSATDPSKITLRWC